MDIKKEQKIKAQEWVVMFDGQIKKSENEIDSYEHHLEVDNQKSEEKSVSWLFKIMPPDKFLVPKTVSTELV